MNAGCDKSGVIALAVAVYSDLNHFRARGLERGTSIDVQRNALDVEQTEDTGIALIEL